MLGLPSIISPLGLAAISPLAGMGYFEMQAISCRCLADILPGL